MTKREIPFDGFWDRPLAGLLQQLRATPAGLTSAEAKRRLRLHGPNSLAQESRFTTLVGLLRFFANPLVIVLLVASALSLVMGDAVGGLIIIVMVLLSVLLNFFMEFQARHAVEEIRKQVATTAAVLRDGQEQELPVAELVPGDVVRLNAGDLVPADGRLLDVKDLQVRESALTGESLPIEKAADDLPTGKHGAAEAKNSVFLGTAVQTGLGTAVIVCTGRDTALGEIAQRLATRPPETEFGRGIRLFGLMITRVIMALVLFVLLVNIVLHRPLLESFLFSVALAVGMTPEMMPLIITVTLAQGARRMTKKKVLVKQLSAIEDFGSVTILCSDKTGTLTEGEIVLDRHVDVEGKEDENVLRLIYLNSFFEAGIKSPLDAAILRHERPKIVEYEKVDEIPFDFNRKRLSVVVRHGDENLLISKGEAESIFAICHTVTVNGVPRPFDERLQVQATQTYQKLSADGYRVLGVAMRKVGQQNTYGLTDEQNMTLAGLAAFLDPPKEGIHAVLEALKQNGISVVVMTGDNQYVTQKVARDVGLAGRPYRHRYSDWTQWTMPPWRPGRERRHLCPRLSRTEEPGYHRPQSPRTRRRLHGRRHQRRAVAAYRRRWHLRDEWRGRRKGRGKDHPAGEGSCGLERWGDRGPALFCQHHEVHRHGHELQFRQHVQHGRGIAFPAIPADVADADPAEQLSL